jgi:Uma2 family endonuclease
MPDGASLAADVASRGQYLFAANEFRRLPLPRDLRIELMEGVLVPMSPVGPAHYSVIYLLELALRPFVEPQYRVRGESSVQLGERTQVQPDIAVIKARDDGYRRRLPGPTDIMLLVEVADSTLSRDRRDKVPLYGLHGIQEFWLVSVAERRIEVYRDALDGVFQSVRTVGEDGVLSLLGVPDARVHVRSLFIEDTE